MRGYLPILLMFFIAIALATVIMVFCRLVRPHFPEKIKSEPYECGLEVVGEARTHFHIRYYLVAVIYLVFDVETVFLYPFAVQFKELALFGVLEIGVFLFLLLFGYGYVWSKGALAWE